MNKAFFPLAALPLCAAALAGATLGAGDAHAAPIALSVQPTTGKFYSGQLIEIEIAIGGLDADDLGGFDLDLDFDPAVIQYQSYSLGVELVDPIFGQDDFSDDSNAASGRLQLAEVSWLLDFTGQPDAFVLATLSFVAQQPGDSPLTLSRVALSDDLGGVLDVDSVAGGSVSVPVPGTLLLLPLGAGLLMMRQTGKRR